MAFVHGLVQQGAVAVGVASQEQRQLADLQCLAAHGRLPMLVQLKPQRLQPQAFQLRAPAHGGHHVVHDDAGVACTHDDAAVRALAQLHFMVGDHRHLFLKQMPQCVGDIRVGQARQLRAASQCGDLQSQPRQRLCNLHAQRTQADDGHARAKGLAFEQGVGGQDALAKALPFLRHHGAGAWSEDELARSQHLAVDLDPIGCQQPGTPVDGPPAQALRSLDRACHELVAQLAHTAQNGGQVRLQSARAAYAEGLEVMAGMEGVGRLDQQLGRHAAYPRAGRAPGAVVDDGEMLSVLAHLAQSRQSGRAGADDDDVQSGGGWVFHAVIPLIAVP